MASYQMLLTITRYCQGCLLLQVIKTHQIERTLRIAKELSDLIVYCRPVSYDNEKGLFLKYQVLLLYLILRIVHNVCVTYATKLRSKLAHSSLLAVFICFLKFDI